MKWETDLQVDLKYVFKILGTVKREKSQVNE